jgi:hypothetical protein
LLHVQRNLADARLDHRDLDHAVLDLLLRQVGLGEEVAALAVIRAHLGGGVVQPVDVLFLADELLHSGEQDIGIEDRVAGDLEAFDDDLESRRAKRGLRFLHARQDVGAGLRKDRWWLGALEDRACVRAGLRQSDGAAKRKGNCRCNAYQCAHRAPCRAIPSVRQNQKTVSDPRVSSLFL